MRRNSNVNKVFLNDDEIKKNIGNRVYAYIRKFSDVEKDILKNSMQDCRDSSLENIIKGKSYPKIPIMVELANHSSRPMCSFIDDKYVNIDMKSRYVNLLSGLSQEEQLRIIFRSWCEKYDILEIYNTEIIAAIFDENRRRSSSIVGYMLRFQRKRMGITEEEMADILGNSKKSVANAERGNNSYSFMTVLSAGVYFDVPLDVFYIGHLNNKKFVLDYMLYELFRDATKTEEKFFIRYIKLYRDYKLGREQDRKDGRVQEITG